MIGDTPLKKFDVEPTNVNDYLKEEYPVIKPMVSKLFSCVQCTCTRTYACTYVHVQWPSTCTMA